MTLFKMFSFVFFICLCFDLISSFPSTYCNAKTKSFLFVFDCQSNLQDQVIAMTKLNAYIKSHTRESNVTSKYVMVTGNQSIWDFKLDLKSDFVCNKTLPISDKTKVSKTWQEETKHVGCTPFTVSFIFSKTLSEAEEDFILQIKVEEQRRNTEIQRFFIIRSSRKSSIDFIYFTPSFQDLDIDDMFLKICDMKQEDFSFPYTDGNYLKSIYYVANRLYHISFNEAECYCDTRHGGNHYIYETQSLEKHVLKQIQNISANYNTTEINIFLGSDLKSMMVGFPSEHISLQPKCVYYYIRTSIEADSNSLLQTEESQFLQNSILKTIDCSTPLEHALVVCKHATDRVFNRTQIIQRNKTSESIHVVDSNSFEVFLKFLYSNDETNHLFLLITGYQCEFLAKNSFYSELKRYLCNRMLMENVKIPPNENNNNIINIVLKENDHFYKIKNIEISHCINYNECKISLDKESIANSSTTDVTIYCLDKGNNHNVKGNCSAHVVNFTLSLEQFKCQTNETQHFYKCIKPIKSQCQDNSNLHNCENFKCPEPFLKCPSSYCIFPFMINDENVDCPLGEDEIWDDEEISSQLMTIFMIRDICIESSIYENLFALSNKKTFMCNNVCPSSYICISSLQKRNTRNIFNNTSETEIIVHIYEIYLPIKRIENHFFPYSNEENVFSLILFLHFYCFNCRLKNFDQEFLYWNFHELILLDLSNNEITHSDNLKSIENFSKLKYLNLSYNEYLIIDANFTFPMSLEIIDLSYTKTSALRSSVLASLRFLQHLNLSYTLIAKFKDMGMPENFKLTTFYIQGLSIEYLETDFFRGLTIELELLASVYVMCCPQILNANISLEKCHAPVDVISSCKHLVGDTLKRIVFWIVGLLTIVGNGIVLVYRIGWNRDIFQKAYGLFISGLAVSDFIMGIYLIIIAFVDAQYKDFYVLNDFHWRNGFVCHFSGILATLSSEVSTFFIFLITLDRFLCVTYTFGEHRFSKTTKLISFTLVWLGSFVLALIPELVPDLEVYSSNGLCLALPLSSKQFKGWLFSFIVFVVLNFVLFLLIAIGQLTIFINLIKIKNSIGNIGRNHQKGSDEISVAKKLAVVAITDFCCWFPIGILGFLSIKGQMFDREVYAWIAVLVLPINSALNPIIYTIPAVYNKCKAKIKEKHTL